MNDKIEKILASSNKKKYIIKTYMQWTLDNDVVKRTILIAQIAGLYGKLELDSDFSHYGYTYAIVNNDNYQIIHHAKVPRRNKCGLYTDYYTITATITGDDCDVDVKKTMSEH